MARRGRKQLRERDERVFSFRLDSLSDDPVEKELRALIEDSEGDQNWSLRDWIIELYGHHRGYSSSNRSQDVADAIVEATNGLWQAFMEIAQTRPNDRQDVRDIGSRNGVAFNDDFIDGMMGSFGRIEDK